MYNVKKFLDLYKMIELSALSKKSDVGQTVKELKEEAEKLIEKGLLSSSDVNFESDEKFLQSVKKFIDSLLAES